MTRQSMTQIIPLHDVLTLQLMFRRNNWRMQSSYSSLNGYNALFPLRLFRNQRIKQEQCVIEFTVDTLFIWSFTIEYNVRLRPHVRSTGGVQRPLIEFTVHISAFRHLQAEHNIRSKPRLQCIIERFISGSTLHYPQFLKIKTSCSKQYGRHS